MRTPGRKGRTLRTPKQQADNDAKLIADFDAANPVGKTVWCWLRTFGPVIETRITHGAWLLPSGQPVCLVAGVSCAVAIWNISDVDETRREALGPIKQID